MLDFLTSKKKVKAWAIKEVPIEVFEVIGIGQINPYCKNEYEDEKFITVVDIANYSNSDNEKEGLVLTKYFTVKKCPKCRKYELVPTKILMNLNSTYIKHEEEIAYEAFEEHPSKEHFLSTIEAFCNHCSTCFDIKIMMKDSWIKEAKKIKERDLITSCWEDVIYD